MNATSTALAGYQRRISPRTRVIALASVALPPFLVFWVVIGVWSLLSYVLLEPSQRFLLPSPAQVLQVGVLAWPNFEAILNAAVVTVEPVVLGFAIATVVGSAFAILMSQAKWIERSLFPYAVVLQTIPLLALVPLIGFWFGYGFSSRVLVCVMIAIFPIITNVLFGLQSVDPSTRDLFILARASRWTRLRKLEWPSALPSFFTGLRIAAGASVAAGLVADYFFATEKPGLGFLIQVYSLQLQSEQLFTAALVSSAVGIVAFLLVRGAGRLVVGSWHESAMHRGDR